MRVFVAGKLVQRSWQDDAGNKRQSVEIQVHHVGPDLQFATAERSPSPQRPTPRRPLSRPRDPPQRGPREPGFGRALRASLGYCRQGHATDMVSVVYRSRLSGFFPDIQRHMTFDAGLRNQLSKQVDEAGHAPRSEGRCRSPKAWWLL